MGIFFQLMVLNLLNWTGFIYAMLLLASHIFVLAGLAVVFRNEKKTAQNSCSVKNSISVIIPARDEAANLPVLFSSLEKQTYQDFEIVLVDDRSQDSTFSLMKSFQEKYPGRVKVLRNEKTFHGKNPKQMVLDVGARNASGDVLLFTDADCRVPPAWVERMSLPYNDDSVGLVFASVTTGNGKGFLAAFQRFDHLLRYHYTAACAGLKNPTGGFGNNLSIRAKALSDIGGFSDIEFSVTEDAQLIARVRDTGKWEITAGSSRDTTVLTKPVSTWRELAVQELRWSTGAVHAPDWKAFAGYGFVMYQLVTGVAAFIPAFFNPFYFHFFLSGVLSMLVVSTAVGIHLGMDRKYWISLIPSLVTAEFLFPVIVLWATFRPVIIWKGESVTGSSDK